MTSPPEKDHPKLVMLGMLHMAQYFPAAFTGIALPFLFRKEGLPLEMFWLLALPAIPRWLKWLIALVVDNYGSARIGRRKSWIIPCTAIGAAAYAALAWIPPTVSAVHLIVGILLAKSFIMAAQDIAVDGYAAESMTDAERATGTSIIGFLGTLANVSGKGVVALVGTFGWARTMMAASALMIAFAAPAIIRREPPPPAATRQRRARGERPSLVKALRRRESRYILPYLVLFGFGAGFFGSMFGVFFADKGLTTTEFGILYAVATLAGSGLGALTTPWLVERIGMRRTAIIGVVALPVEGFIFRALALDPGLPVLPMLTLVVAILGFVTSIYSYVVNNSRFRWASKAQAATDYSMQSSLWNFGLWVAGSTAGFVAADLGWATFFPIAGCFAGAGGVFYIVMFDRIEAMVRRRERDELEGAAVAAS